jgi:hypothetical protein
MVPGEATEDVCVDGVPSSWAVATEGDIPAASDVAAMR